MFAGLRKKSKKSGVVMQKPDRIVMYFSAVAAYMLAVILYFWG